MAGQLSVRPWSAWVGHYPTHRARYLTTRSLAPAIFTSIALSSNRCSAQGRPRVRVSWAEWSNSCGMVHLMMMSFACLPQIAEPQAFDPQVSSWTGAFADPSALLIRSIAVEVIGYFSEE